MQQSEKDFLEKLESRTAEQRRLLNTTITPPWLQWLVAYLADNPWRVILPVSVFIYVLLWLLLGEMWPQAILSLFGKNL